MLNALNTIPPKVSRTELKILFLCALMNIQRLKNFQDVLSSTHHLRGFMELNNVPTTAFELSVWFYIDDTSALFLCLFVTAILPRSPKVFAGHALSALHVFGSFFSNAHKEASCKKER